MLEIEFDFSSCNCLERCDQLSYSFNINHYRNAWAPLISSKTWKHCLLLELWLYSFWYHTWRTFILRSDTLHLAFQIFWPSLAAWWGCLPESLCSLLLKSFGTFLKPFNLQLASRRLHHKQFGDRGNREDGEEFWWSRITSSIVWGKLFGTCWKKATSMACIIRAIRDSKCLNEFYGSSPSSYC